EVMISFGVPARTRTPYPTVALDIRIARLGSGRHFRQHRRARLARDRERAQLACFDLCCGRRHRTEHDLGVTCDHRGDCRASATEWDLRDIERERCAELLAGEKRRGPGPW